MKILFHEKAYRLVKGAMIVIAIMMLGYVAYAATTQTISNTGTITVGAKNFALAAPTCGTGGSASGGATPLCEFVSQPTCGSTSGTYNTSTATYTIADWSIAQGGSQTKYVCLENTGASTTATVSWAAGTGTPVGLTCTSTIAAKAIGNNAFLAVDLACTASLSTNAGTTVDFGSFTIS
ncbi:MAG TPA: hypothetical protein VNA15_02960 [Candidatus Angelobacter sp.]|nr:hypothetical protein [Candidatus Angelobacter sp.]